MLCAFVLLITYGSITHVVECMMAIAMWFQPSASMATEGQDADVCRLAGKQTWFDVGIALS